MTTRHSRKFITIIAFLVAGCILLNFSLCYAKDKVARSIDLGNQFLSAGAYKTAIGCFKKALPDAKDQESKENIYYGLSFAYMGKGVETYIVDKDDGDYLLSIEYAKKALSINPDNWKAMINLGTVYMNMNDFIKARTYFNKAQRKAEDLTDPNDPYYLELLMTKEQLQAKMRTPGR